jgi:hypothetical protein
MSRLARTLVLAATLAAMLLAGLTAAVQAHPAVGGDAARGQALAQERYYESFDRQDPATQAALAQERYYSTWGYEVPAVRQALAQEHYYSTWRASDPTAAAPAPPSGQPAWLVPVIGVLAAALALLGIRATMITRRRRGRVRVRQPA